MTPGRIGHDGVEGKNPAVPEDACDDVEADVVYHDEGTDGDSEILCKYDRQDFNTVDGASSPEHQAAADAGNYASEKGAEEEVLAGQGRGERNVNRKYVRDQVGE